jgi:hypothetical protein
MNCRFAQPATAAGILFLLLTLTTLSVPVHSTTYIGLYSDEGHSECSVYPQLYQIVYVWVWIQPGEDGFLCAEYEITVPTNVIDAATIVNPAAGYHIGDAIVPPGTTVCFPDCLSDWVWTHQMTCLVTDFNPSIITLDPHDDIGILRSANCVDFGDGYEEMTKINDMFINQGCCLSTETSSWGAIKSLLK